MLTALHPILDVWGDLCFAFAGNLDGKKGNELFVSPNFMNDPMSGLSGSLSGARAARDLITILKFFEEEHAVRIDIKRDSRWRPFFQEEFTLFSSRVHLRVTQL